MMRQANMLWAGSGWCDWLGGRSGTSNAIRGGVVRCQVLEGWSRRFFLGFSEIVFSLGGISYVVVR